MNKKVPIVGYLHILCINHYFELISEQLKIIINSGLYDEVENIFVGVLGENQELKKVQALFEEYPKFIIAEYSTDRGKFEFQTLKILKDHADKAKGNYYGFYIHTKGVTWPKPKEGDPITISKSGISSDQAYNGGKYLFDYANYFILQEWKDNVFELDKGYETCGIQLRPKREFPCHYSGNAWWFNSGYIKILKKVEHLNRLDRFQAEWLVGSGNPIAATLCQHFADYSTKGKFSDLFQNEDQMVIPEPTGKAPEEIKGRTIVHTLSWNTVAETTEAVRQLYEMNDRRDFEHWILDLGFPLLNAEEIPTDIKGAIMANSDALRALSEKYGSQYLKMENLGVSPNWSRIAKYLKVTDGDVICGCDPDERIDPKCGGWVKACADVIRADETIGVVSLIMEEQFPILNKDNSLERTVNGVNIIEVRGALMWATCALSGKLFKEMGEVIPAPAEAPIYGGLEGQLIHQMNRLGYKWAFTKDYIVKHPDHAPLELLRQWKDNLIHDLKRIGRQIPFDEWLEMKRNGEQI